MSCGHLNESYYKVEQCFTVMNYCSSFNIPGQVTIFLSCERFSLETTFGVRNSETTFGVRNSETTFGVRNLETTYGFRNSETTFGVRNSETSRVLNYVWNAVHVKHEFVRKIFCLPRKQRNLSYRFHRDFHIQSKQ